MKSYTALFLVLLMLSVLTACASATPSTVPHANQTMAPDFTVYTAAGEAVKLSELRGKPVVVNFWASWCGPCKSEMPDFEEAYLQLGQDVQFVMVNLTDGDRETVQTATDFISAQGYTFPVFFDTKYSAANAYQVRSIPATYFINAEGHVVAQFTGAMNAEQLQQGIALIWKET